MLGGGGRRGLARDVGAFLVGLAVYHCLSGLPLSARPELVPVRSTLALIRGEGAAAACPLCVACASNASGAACPPCATCPPPGEAAAAPCPPCATATGAPPPPPPGACVVEPRSGEQFLTWKRKVVSLEVKPVYKCPNKCSGKGACVDGACVCTGGFRGGDCSYRPNAPAPQIVSGPKLDALWAHTFSQGATLLTKFQILASVLASGNLPEGHVVELGVYKGGSAAGMAYTMNSTSVKNIWLYDTFEGHPAGVDNALNPGSFHRMLPSQLEGKFVGTLDEVNNAFHDVGFTPEWVAEHVVFRKGYFNITMLDEIPDAIALLHIDCDWYECTMDAFRRFYDRLACSGAVILDDYGYLAGQRQAYHDFVSERNINPMPMVFGKSYSASFRKWC